MTPQELLEVKEKIETAKSNKAKAEGQMEQIEAIWKKEFKCNNKEEAEKMLLELEQRKSKLDKKYETACNELTEQINALEN